MTKQVLRALAYQSFKEYCLWDGIDSKISFEYWVLFSKYTASFLFTIEG